ncbi:MAG: acetyl-CoA carboxylase biotin carboxylase subunit [Mycoplasmatales bacterium]
MKILVANRGEIAVRIIRTIKQMGYESVAIYTREEKEALHVKLADYSVCIGTEREPYSYRDIVKIATVACELGVDAIHPGYGFLSENANFVKICEDLDIKFIGPSSKVIELLGDKINAIATMKKVGVPTVPGFAEPVKNVEQLVEKAQEIGYPIMLKSASGGGGKGLRIVNTDHELEEAFFTIQKEVVEDVPRIFMEKYFTNAKHVEVQIIADPQGNVLCLGNRDCSIQRNNQKVIEEAPANLKPDLAQQMFDVTIKAVKEIGYYSAGTFEYLVEDDKFYFLEVNTRVQVEHPITEMIFGFDIIKEQIKIIKSGELSCQQSDLIQRGHAIEVRINAEDGMNNFRPSPGKIIDLHLPGGMNVRNDFGVYSKSIVSPTYDSLLGKIICYGSTRETALKRLRIALLELNIEGIKTTRELASKIITDDLFVSREYKTNYIANNYERLTNNHVEN